MLKPKTALFLLTLVLLILGPAYNAFAESTINCHCFQDRSYDPTDKFAADDYILAHFKNQKPEIFVEQYKKQGSSWSQIAFNLGVEPAAAGKLILAYPAKQIDK